MTPLAHLLVDASLAEPRACVMSASPRDDRDAERRVQALEACALSARFIQGR